jgi:hypothetical protein
LPLVERVALELSCSNASNHLQGDLTHA